MDHKNYYSRHLIKKLVYPIETPTTEHQFKVLESTSAETARWCDEKGKSRNDTGTIPAPIRSTDIFLRLATPQIGSFKYYIPKDAPHEIEVTPDGTRLINCQYKASRTRTSHSF